jgi:XRE family transcriptional regulator, regulator of sulfur utilization
VSDPRKLLGKAIRKRRNALGMTQEKLAEAAELHTTYISGVERGVFNISILKLARIAGGLKLAVRDLVKDF